MGMEVDAKCLDCGHVFTVQLGGGFAFHLVRCDQCGVTKSISFDELGDLHVRYVKGLDRPWSVVSAHHDRYIQEEVPVEPITEDQYNAGIETVAGACACGGHFSLNAPPRCPKCCSLRIEEGEAGLMYD